MKRQSGQRWGRLFLAGILIATGVILWSHQKVLSTQQEPSSQEDPTSQFIVNKVDPGDLRYIAVGDSYTIGTGATPDQSWPALLTRDLRAKGIEIGLAANLGIDGWTTDDAIHNELPVYRASSPTFATLMIGVNDTYRKTTPDQFRTELSLVMNTMLLSLRDSGHLVVMTIPDYSVTPIGVQYSHQNDAAHKIILFNAIIKEEAQKRHLAVIDLYSLSQAMGKDRTLVAGDGLHPSAKEYRIWEQHMVGTIYDLLKVQKKNSVHANSVHAIEMTPTSR